MGGINWQTMRETEQERAAARSREQRAELAQQSTPAVDEALSWLEAEARSVQEVYEQLSFLGPVEDAIVEDFLRTSPTYGDRFVRDVAALGVRDKNHGNRVRADDLRYRREAPEGFQKVLSTISRLRDSGRNVFALTPELLPENLMRVWPPKRPLPELVVVNMDLGTPRVSVVRRLPSAGGARINRGTLLSMAGTVAKVMGEPGALREVAANQGVTVDHDFTKVEVNLAEIAWSPHLELGELLYDWEEVEGEEVSEVDEARAEAARGSVEHADHRMGVNQGFLTDLGGRIDDLRVGWGREGGDEARAARERLSGLEARRGAALGKTEKLREERDALAEAIDSGDQEALDKQERRLEDALAALEQETTDLGEAVAAEERLFEAHRKLVEQEKARDVAKTPPLPEPVDDKRRIEKVFEDVEREAEEREDTRNGRS